MNDFTPKHRDFVVLKINEKCTEKSLIGFTAIYQINNKFDVNECNSVLENGYYDARYATEIEIEYWYSENGEFPDLQKLSDVGSVHFSSWLEWKENNKL